jgi:hypothetical protein
MKRLLLSVLAVVGMAVLVPASAMAVTPTGTTYIAGTITHNGSPVSGASVAVTCNSNVLDSSTTVAGGYLVQFPAGQCPDSATAGVAASKGALGGSNSGTVDSLTTDINLALVNVSIVPELGLITGIGATIMGGGAFLVLRQRHLSGYKA